MKIVITAGDCNGIGIELIAKSLADNRLSTAEFAICCNAKTLAEYAAAMKLDAQIISDEVFIADKKCKLLSCDAYAPVEFGAITEDAGRLAIEQLERSLAELNKGNFDALITMPIAKIALRLAGWNFPGQTEMLEARCGGKAMMMLLSNSVRVALQTIHTPLAKVPSEISIMEIARKILSLDKILQQDFNIRKPKIAVLGLNPHAGEGGYIGNEEITVITPAIACARENGVCVEGAFPADGFFAFGEYLQYDAILAMYHDQGLIPLKLLARGGGVNYTAGLPVVRASPDHGTAFGIAGRGVCDASSAIEAISTAISIVEARRKSEISPTRIPNA